MTQAVKVETNYKQVKEVNKALTKEYPDTILNVWCAVGSLNDDADIGITVNKTTFDKAILKNNKLKDIGPFSAKAVFEMAMGLADAQVQMTKTNLPKTVIARAMLASAQEIIEKYYE